MTTHVGMGGRGARTPPGHKTMKGDDYTAFKGEERVERAAATGYSIHLTQVGKDWWGFIVFKRRNAIGHEDFYASYDVALRDANELIRKHAEVAS